MLQKLRFLGFGSAFGLLLLAVAACSAIKTTNPQTAGSLSSAGETIYKQSCVKCHGEDGQKVPGSAIMGPDNVLDRYQTGQGLYDFISRLMPDDKPGSLSTEQYLQVESYLLLHDGYLKPDTPFSQNDLERILLTKPQ